MKHYFKLMIDGLRHKAARSAMFGAAFWLLCTGLWTGGSLSAQNYTAVDIRDLSYSVVVPDTTLMLGQSIEATINIGNVNSIVRQAIGFDIWIELGCNAKPLQTLQPNMSSSWMQEVPLLPLETKSTTIPNRYDYHFLKTYAVNGNGLVIKLVLTANINNVHSSRLIARVGGLVQVDNLELKMANPGLQAPTMDALSAAPFAPNTAGLSIWPNPAAKSKQSDIRLYWNAETIVSTSVMNLAGQVVREFGATQSLDMSDLPAGTYLLRVRNTHGDLVNHKLVLY